MHFDGAYISTYREHVELDRDTIEARSFTAGYIIRNARRMFLFLSGVLRKVNEV